MNVLLAFVIFTGIAWLATPVRRRQVLRGPAQLAGRRGRAPAGRRDRRHRRRPVRVLQRRPRSWPPSERPRRRDGHPRPSSTRTAAPATSTSRSGRRRRSTRRRRARRSRPLGEHDARSRPTSSATTAVDLPSAIQIGAQRDGPLARADRRRPRRSLVGLGRQRPDRARRRSRARSGSRPRSATSSGSSGRS